MNAIPSDDVEARAEAALRQSPVPPGPPPETIIRTLGALRAAADAPSTLSSLKRSWVRRVLQLAAVLLVACLVGSAIFLRLDSPLVFAKVAEKLRDAHTLAYRMTMHLPTVGKEPVAVQIFLKEPGRTRMEAPGGGITLGHSENGRFKVLSLDPTTKMAVQMAGNRTDRRPQPGQTDPMNWIDEMRRLAEKNAQPAGQKRIGDVDAHGFRIREGPVEWLVWADPKTRLPVEVELTMPDNLRGTMSEFRFNPPLDDALFSMEVPKGYNLLPVEIEDLTPEESLSRMLRRYAESAAGQFPNGLENPVGLMKQLREARGGKAKDKPSPEGMRDGMNLVRAVQFVITMKGGYGYKPDGVKLGDANKILFWYRPDKSTKYRALYGDLHWADVTTDQLPEKPKP